jgi:hypothetical protein
MNAPVDRVAIVVGLPASVLKRVEARFRDTVRIKAVQLIQRGEYQLESNPILASHMVEQFADFATTYERVGIVVLPYHRAVEMVNEKVALLEELGVRVYRTPPGELPWPALYAKHGMDPTFEQALLERVSACIDACFPPAPIPVDEADQVKFELLRGLASHNKMGPNNHSHEDDLWKSRAQGWGSREREAIIKDLMAAKLLNRKKNKSAGGKGWVYWIEDVQLACTTYPKLRDVIG